MCACVLSHSIVLILCDPMDCSPPASSVHEILQARILDGLPFPVPGDIPDLVTEPMSPALAGEFFTTEPPGKPRLCDMGYEKKKYFFISHCLHCAPHSLSARQVVAVI